MNLYHSLRTKVSSWFVFKVERTILFEIHGILQHCLTSVKTTVWFSPQTTWRTWCDLKDFIKVGIKRSTSTTWNKSDKQTVYVVFWQNQSSHSYIFNLIHLNKRIAKKCLPLLSLTPSWPKLKKNHNIQKYKFLIRCHTSYNKLKNGTFCSNKLNCASPHTWKKQVQQKQRRLLFVLRNK